MTGNLLGTTLFVLVAAGQAITEAFAGWKF